MMKIFLLTTVLFLGLGPAAAQVAPDWEALEILRDDGKLEEALRLLESWPESGFAGDDRVRFLAGRQQLLHGLGRYPEAQQAGRPWIDWARKASDLPEEARAHNNVGRARQVFEQVRQLGRAQGSLALEAITHHFDYLEKEFLLHLDVMAGVDHVIELGIADPERLIKMGWSAGGHMTNKIITFTDRFKAASSGAGAVNWISMYGQSDIRIYRTPWFLGTPWEKDAPIDTYWENSPLKDIWKVKTPTLILVGEKDVRVPPPQSVELYRALKAIGVPTRLYIAPRQAHGWRELRHRLFKINVELDWFARHALGEEYEWESAPED